MGTKESGLPKISRALRVIELLQIFLFPLLISTLFLWGSFPNSSFLKYLTVVIGSVCALLVLCSILMKSFKITPAPPDSE